MRDPLGVRRRILSEPSETTASLVLTPYTKEYIMPLDQDIKREIIADDKLKAVFDGKDKVSMFEMTKLVSNHVSS